MDCATNYILLFIVKSPNIWYIVLTCYMLWTWLCLYSWDYNLNWIYGLRINFITLHYITGRVGSVWG
jgi:hypothetical protein